MADLIERDTVIWITAETGALETQRRVKELPAINRWIPCNERLPEQEGLYLVTTVSGNVYIRSFYFSLASKRPYFSGDEKVIAWMQRPDAYEPPEGE